MRYANRVGSVEIPCSLRVICVTRTKLSGRSLAWWCQVDKGCGKVDDSEPSKSRLSWLPLSTWAHLLCHAATCFFRKLLKGLQYIPRPCQLTGTGTNTTEKDGKSYLFLPSGGHSRERDLLPDLESFPQLLTICECGQPMSTQAEVLTDGTIG